VPKVLYTIGYSGYALEEFLDEIKAHKISTVIDVRSVPYSQYHSDYNKEFLAATLKSNHIHYRNYANEFGAQQKNIDFYSPEGYLDFEKFSKSEQFLSGVKKIRTGMDAGYVCTLMCAEKDPMDCHRTIMISREFHEMGMKVVHLLPGGLQQSQADVEERLLDHYYPNRNQLVLFENENFSTQEYIAKAYRQKNAEIGYTGGGDEHDDIYNRVHAKNRTAVL